jgi:SM-20-related protein
MEDDVLDDREIQLAVYEGKGEYYLRHKDAFRVDSNNLKDGQKLRKITVIAYFNPDLPRYDSKAKLGELRLYLKDKIVDVTPRLGRVIIFKSEKVEHEVKPTLGY